MPRISVVVAVKNGARTLQRCIDSVSNQTHPLKELLIVDGKSSDETLDILSRNDDAITWWTSEADTGIYQAWNKALAHINGDWICFLGADDYLWDSRVLEQIAPNLAGAYPAVRVVYGQVALVNEAGEVLDNCGTPWAEMRHAFMAGEALNIHQATFHHRSLFEMWGRFDETFRIAGDYELLLRELRANEALYVPHLVAAMQHGGVSSNPSNKMNTTSEIMRAMRMNGLRPKASLRLAWFRAVIHALLYHVAGRQISSAIADDYRRFMGKRRLWTSTGNEDPINRRTR